MFQEKIYFIISIRNVIFYIHNMQKSGNFQRGNNFVRKFYVCESFNRTNTRELLLIKNKTLKIRNETYCIKYFIKSAANCS